MAYTTYTTEAMVCGTYDRNTADRSYRLFTRELGMLYADARSVRKELSRQRQALQDFSRIKVSLVKGKGGWKIGSVAELKNYYSSSPDQAARGSVVMIIRLLRRFVAGEEVGTDMYDQSVAALDFFSGKIEQRQCFEKVFTQRLLNMLGYIRTKDVPELYQDVSLVEIDSKQVCVFEKQVSLSIEQAQTASQL